MFKISKKACYVHCGPQSIRVSLGEGLPVDSCYDEYTWNGSDWFDGFSCVLGEVRKYARKKDVVLILPEHMVLSMNVSVPVVSKSKQNRMIAYAVESQLADCGELTWSYSIPEQDEIELKLQVFAIKTELANRIYRVCRGLGVRVVRLLPVFASETLNYPRQDTMGSIFSSVSRLWIEPGTDLDLLPEPIAKENAFSKRKPYLLGIVCCLALATIPWILSLQRQLEHADREYQNIVSEFAQRKEVEQQINRNHLESEQLRSQIGSLLSIESDRGRYTRFFSDLQTRLQRVEDTWFEEFRLIESGSQVVQLSGKMLIRNYDSETPEVSSLYAASRLNQLIDDLKASDYITSMSELRIDNSMPRILGFAMQVELKPL